MRSFDARRLLRLVEQPGAAHCASLGIWRLGADDDDDDDDTEEAPPARRSGGEVRRGNAAMRVVAEFIRGECALPSVSTQKPEPGVGRLRLAVVEDQGF